MKVYFRNPYFALAALILAAYLVSAWSDRQNRLQQLNLTGASGQSQVDAASLSWLAPQLGQLPETVPYPALEPLHALESSGLGLLDSDSAVARAARLELARWTALGEFPWQTERLKIIKVRGQNAYELHLTATGEEAQVLSWTEYILASPTGIGYLCDPGRSHLMAVQAGQLKLDLMIRVWPAEAFLAPPEVAEASS
jgi:hypothetical protein